MHSAARPVALLIALAVLLVCATGAYADNFTFTYSGSNITGTGTVAATPDGGGVYTITSITGSQTIFGLTGAAAALNGTQTITGIVAPVASDFFSLPGGAYGWLYDDQITPGANPAVDYYGPLLYLAGLSAPSNTVNICSYCGNGEEYSELIYVGTGGNLNGFGGAFEDLAITSGTLIDPATSPVPEPSSLMLLGSGLVGLIFMGYRKRFTGLGERA